jgi:hypothetical protein
MKMCTYDSIDGSYYRCCGDQISVGCKIKASLVVVKMSMLHVHHVICENNNMHVDCSLVIVCGLT